MSISIAPRELVPVVETLLGDIDTPVSAFKKLNRSDSFLLESVTGGDQVARYSYIGLDPFLTVITKDGVTSVTMDGHTQQSSDSPIDILDSLVDQISIKSLDGLPPFVGGAVGFFSWETIGHIELIPFKSTPDMTFPLAHFVCPRQLIVFDHVKRQMDLIILAESTQVDVAAQQLADLKGLLSQPLASPLVSVSPVDVDALWSQVRSNYTQSQFESDVTAVKRHIHEGDVFQLVLSQKFSVTSQRPPFEVYRQLRQINPSPYMFYFQFSDYQLIGASPEILVRLDDRKAMVRPIAGTRPRISGQEDALIKELRADGKECAEHIMLVDLGRNDLGRVCEFESIRTSSLMDIERYSHVLHMVSTVEGQLRSDQSAFDLFKATFPAGTLSGAPKIRAMELINQFESDARGPYGGALGYFDFRGNMDLCIIIRTILSDAHGYHVQAGAGIVADSVPETEYFETISKAKGMISACGIGDA